MMKGIAVRTIGAVSLAIFGIGTLIAGFAANQGGGDKTFCSAYGSITPLFPGEEPPRPEGCRSDTQVEYRAVSVESADELELRLSSLIVECWSENKGFNSTERLCEGWNVEYAPGPAVTEDSLTEEMKENDLCPQRIENSDQNCGQNNQIQMGDDVDQGDFILVSYNSTAGDARVEVE